MLISIETVKLASSQHHFYFDVHKVCGKLGRGTTALGGWYIHVKSPSLGGRLPLFDPISLLNIHLPPRSGNLPLFGPHLLPMIFSLKRRNCIEFSNENALLKSAKCPSNTKIQCFCIISRVLSHSKERISHHFQNFSLNLNFAG